MCSKLMCVSVYLSVSLDISFLFSAMNRPETIIVLISLSLSFFLFSRGVACHIYIDRIWLSLTARCWGEKE